MDDVASESQLSIAESVFGEEKIVPGVPVSAELAYPEVVVTGYNDVRVPGLTATLVMSSVAELSSLLVTKSLPLSASSLGSTRRRKSSPSK